MIIVKQYYVNQQIHHSGDRWSSPPTPPTPPPTWKHLTGQCHWPLSDTGCGIPRSVASHIVVSLWVWMRTLLIWSLMTCDLQWCPPISRCHAEGSCSADRQERYSDVDVSYSCSRHPPPPPCMTADGHTIVCPTQNDTSFFVKNR